MTTINIHIENVTIGRGSDGLNIDVPVPARDDVPPAVRHLTVGLDPLREAAVALVACSPTLGSDGHARAALKAARGLIEQVRAAMPYGYALTGEVDEGALAYFVDACYGYGDHEPEAIVKIALAENDEDLAAAYVAVTHAILAAGLYDHGFDL